MQRKEVTFVSGIDTCAAWLYPAGATAGRTARARMIVMAHGLSGTRRDRLGAFAERFAAAGVAALVFDHRGFGDSSGEPDLFDPGASSRTGARRSRTPARCPASTPTGSRRSVLDGWRQRARGRRRGPPRRCRDQPGAVPRPRRQAYRSAPRVQPRSCAAAAPAAICPPSGSHTRPRSSTPRGRGRLAPRRGDRRGLALAQPRLGRMAARPAYRPIRHAETLHCPWLVCVGEADSVALPGPAIAAARRAPTGELRTYPGVDHFDIYDGPEHEAVVADESPSSAATCSPRPSRPAPAPRPAPGSEV